MADDWTEPDEHIGEALESILPRFGLNLPRGMRGAQFMTEVREGAPGIDRDPALFAWLGVKILNAAYRDEIHPDLASELSARIAKVSARHDDPSSSGGASA
jgi:hypothetical protein